MRIEEKSEKAVYAEEKFIPKTRYNEIIKLSLFLLTFTCVAVVGGQSLINPSGIWSIQGVNMTHTDVFSWGENPIHNDAVIIDLGAKPPYMVVSSETFNVKSYTQEGCRFIFNGEWGTENAWLTPGSIVVIYSEDGNSLYFESVAPERFGDIVDLGESHRLFRVPVDAPVVPIGPEGP